MLISLSILPVTLILVHSVQSGDLYKSKQVPRRHTEIIRSRNVHQPSVLNNIEFNPVPDDFENLGVIKGDDKNAVKSARSVNHPPSAVDYYDDNPHIGKSEHEKEVMKSKTEAEKRERSLTAVQSNNGTARQKRRMRVRRVKVNKTQIQTDLTSSEIFDTTISPAPVAEERSVNKTEKSEENSGQEYPKLKRPSQNTKEIQTPMGPYTSKRRNGLREPVVPIVESENYVFAHSGDFHYSYEGGDGTKAYERGELKTSNGGAGNAVEGSFSYKDKDGNDFSLTYTADENGYRPVGAHLPTPPPIPIAIQRALALLATKTTPEPITEPNRISLL